jgi:hypothetical protein
VARRERAPEHKPDAATDECSRHLDGIREDAAGRGIDEAQRRAGTG